MPTGFLGSFLIPVTHVGHRKRTVWTFTFVFFFSSGADGIQKILQSDWFLERAEFSQTDRYSGRNPSSWSIFVNELAVIVNLSPFLHFYRQLINASLSLFTSRWQEKLLLVNSIEFFWSFESLYGCLFLGPVMVRKPVCLSVQFWVNFSRVCLSNRCCIWENYCGVHLTNFLAICYSIYGNSVEWFAMIDRENNFGDLNWGTVSALT